MMAKRKAKESGRGDLDKILKSVHKKFGQDSLNILSDHEEFATVKRFVSFGHWGIDRIVSGLSSGGGAPVGRLTEIYGGFSTGKTLLLAHLLAECQRAGGLAILDDTEHAYMKDFGDSIGVDHSTLLYSMSETVEEVFNKMIYTLTSVLSDNPDQLVLYAWDSLALVSSEAEKEQDLGDSGYHTEKARAIGQGTRKVVSLIGKSNVALVIANQTRQNIGVLFGDKEVTPGGDAVPFWSSVRVRLARRELIKTDKKVVGARGVAEVKKSKIAPPFKSCEFDMMFDTGLARYSGVVDLLSKEGILHPSDRKGYFEFDGKQYTKKNIEKYFQENPESLEELME